VGRFLLVTVITQHDQGGDRAAVTIKESVVVGEKALRKLGIVLAMDFDVDVDPLLAACPCDNLDETVGEVLAEFCILNALGKFLVEKDMRRLLVDFGVRQREGEGHQLGEVAHQHTLPRGVVIVAWLGSHGCRVRET